MVGTGFLVSDPGADGRPRTVLVTAAHVLRSMPEVEARIGYRSREPSGSWSYTPSKLTIRDKDGASRWVSHPVRDIAAMVVEAPTEFAKAAIPLSYLTADEALALRSITPGEEMMVLGFPKGLSANNAGFPILRAGRVASCPIAPTQFPTFLLDFTVFPGNSGGPVFMAPSGAGSGAGTGGRGYITGILTQEVQLENERMGIGVVTHAKYIAETVSLLRPGPATITLARDDEVVRGARPASQRPPSLIARVQRTMSRADAWMNKHIAEPAGKMGPWLRRLANRWRL